MERLKKKRSALRTQATKLISEADSSLEAQADETTLNVLSARLGALLTQLNEVDAAVEPLVPDEEAEENYARTIAYNDRIITYVARLSQQAGAQRANAITAAEASRAPRNGNLRANGSKVKLPKLELQRFSGAATEWQPFWEQYQQAIHDNDALSHGEKFLYLQSALSGRAAAAVAGIQATAANYNTVIELLKERFGRTDVLIQEHLTQLLDLPTVRSGQEVRDLRRLYDHMQRNIAALTALGVQTGSYGAMLASALLRMLPGELVVEYHKHCSAEKKEDSLCIASLQCFLKNEVESREKALQVGQREGKGSSTKPRFDNERSRAPRASAASLLTASDSKQKEPCAFCAAKDHVTKECQTPLSLEERKGALLKAGRCFRCSIKGHTSRECRNKGVKCKICSKRHLTQMCNPAWKPAANTATELHSATGSKEDKTTTVLLQTAQIWAKGTQRKLLTRALFDGGSQRTFVTEELSRQLNLEVLGEEDITIFPFGGADSAMKKKRRRVRLWLRSQYDRKEHCLEALEIPEICSDELLVPERVMKEVKMKVADLADVTLPPAQLEQNGIGILIGADYYWSLVTGEVQKLQGGLVAIKTHFGWTLQGTVPYSNTSTTVAVLRAVVAENKCALTTQLKSFWELESMGIVDQVPHNQEHEEVHKAFESSIKFTNGRYEVALPWKPVDFRLADNEGVAKKRLASLTQKLLKDEAMLTKYDEAIRQYLEQGFAERLPKDAVSIENRLYYMPHRAVLRPASLSTSVRVVFDASSSDTGCVSLNEALDSGPNLNPDILKVMLNFRTHRIGLSADIEKAFLQISLRKEDRDAVRFLWYGEVPTKKNPNPSLEVWRMTRVPFGVTSSPFLLAATIRHHLGMMDNCSGTARTLADSFYVDDLISGADTEEAAEEFYREALGIMKGASMSLRKWNSNSKRLQEIFQNEGTGCPTNTVQCPTSGTTRVLGLVWDKEKDHLAFSIEPILDFLDRNCNTKRFILQASARIFDPLGLLSPVTVTAKLMFQELWELGVGWDAPLPEEVQAVWTQWHTALYHLTAVTVPRCCVSAEYDKVEIHIFTDASPKAYGAVAYLRVCRLGIPNANLILSKSRVAPLKKLSLPRLELMGMLMGARLKDYLARSFTLQVEEWFLWTDSTISLHWVRGSARQWKPFVANRVMEIQRLTDPDQWNHCPGAENVADLLTRGVSPEVLKTTTVWWHGPSWLSQPSPEWPHSETVCEDMTAEEERKPVHVHTVAQSVEKSALPFKQFSSLTKLIRVVAWMQRFVHNSRYPLEKEQGFLTAEQINKAQICLIREVQREAFSEELQCIFHSARIPKGSPLRDLNVFLDSHGVLRVGGRLRNAEMPYDTRHPIVLPPNHPYIDLLIEGTHRRLLHAGPLETLTELREQFWIMKGRQVVKRTLKRCVTCDRFNCRAATEVAAPLPPERVTKALPFEVTGIDFAGPLYTKDQGRNKKSYILLFTCAVTRAIHLELVTDMSIDSFLKAFRRFVARRGVCRVIFSDNAKTFQRASRDLRRLWKTIRGKELQNYFAEHRIQWNFIAERAPWWGGFWERLVRSVKSSLKKVLGNSYCTFEELATILTEIEAVINSRPLTYVSAEANEVEPLTPSHFLVGKRLTSLPTSSSEDATPRPNNLERSWKYRQRITDQFWRRWQKEYLNSLRSAHFYVPTSSNAIREGTAVLVYEHLLPRQLWKMGVVAEVLIGRDGRIRACMVRLPSGTVIRRPVQLLYPLESLRE